jgi:hypothetical protein
MKRLGFLDVILLSLDSLKTQPTLIVPVFVTFFVDYLIFSLAFNTFSLSELLEQDLAQLLVLSAALYVFVVCGASVVCGMTKVGIAVGDSSIADGLQEAEHHIFSVIVASVIGGIISGTLLIGGIIVVTQVVSEAGILAALLYAFVILLSFMLGILFLYALPAIIVDELDSVTAIGVSIGIVLNHLKESLGLAFLALVVLVVGVYSSGYVSGLLHYFVLLLVVSLVVTLLVVAVTVDYVNVK